MRILGNKEKSSGVPGPAAGVIGEKLLPMHRPLTFLNSFWSLDPGLVVMFHEPLAFGAVSTDSALFFVDCIRDPLVFIVKAFEPCSEVFDPVYYFIHVVTFTESL